MNEATLLGCSKCGELCRSRTRIVEGDGPERCRILIVGEAPGENEDAVGLPFVGKTGKYLRGKASEYGATIRETRYTNAVRCRPEGNRTPTREEIVNCNDWLLSEIVESEPELIICAGRVSEVAVGLVLEQLDKEIRVVRIYHPSYVMRKSKERSGWEKELAEAIRLVIGDGKEIVNHHSVVDGWSYGEPDWDNYYLAVDTETDDGEEHWSAKLVTSQWSDGEKGLLSWGNRPRNGINHVFLHHAMYDAPLLGIDLHDLDSWDDTMLMASVLRLPVGLKEIGPAVTGIKMSPITDFIGTKKNRNAISVSEAYRVHGMGMSEYAVKDAVVTSRLAKVLDTEIRKDEKLFRYYEEIEKPICAILLDMERDGVLIDEEKLVGLSERLNRQLGVVLDECGKVFGQVALGSNKQVAAKLIELGVELDETTASGAWSVDADVIDGIRGGTEDDAVREFCELLLSYREMKKLDSTYAKGLLNQRDSRGYVHTHWNQVSAETNRILSSNPNLMNQPNPEKGSSNQREWGRVIRSSFIAEDGFVIVKGDLSQLEVRIFADYTNEPVLIRAYENDWDVHQGVADALGVERAIAKNCLFCSVYGGGPDKLAETAGLTRDEVEPFLSNLRKNMPSLIEWPKRVAAELDRDGYVETKYGWRGIYRGYWSPVPSERNDALREAGNMPIQGTAAGAAKRIMIALREVCRKYDARLVLHVYDEFVSMVPRGAVEEFCREFNGLVEVVKPEIQVPLKLEIGYGPSWGQLTKWKGLE